MELTVKELCSRYGISSRKTLYSRLNGLGITELSKQHNKSYATEDQIALLDLQDEHLKSGGTIKNFVPPSKVSVHNSPELTTQDTPQTVDITPVEDTAHHNSELSVVQTTQILEMVAQFMNQQPIDPLWHLERLEKAAASNWLLTTSEVEQLIGVKPVCAGKSDVFRRGSFDFIKSGSIGRETSWQVVKVVSKI